MRRGFRRECRRTGDHHIRRRLTADGDGSRIGGEIRAGDGDGLAADQWTIVRTDHSHCRGVGIGVEVVAGTARAARRRNHDIGQPGSMRARSCGDCRRSRRADDRRRGPADADGRRTKEILPGDGDALAAAERAAGRADGGHRRDILIGVAVDERTRAAGCRRNDDALRPGDICRRCGANGRAGDRPNRRRYSANGDERRARYEIAAGDGNGLVAGQRAGGWTDGGHAGPSIECVDAARR